MSYLRLCGSGSGRCIHDGACELKGGCIYRSTDSSNSNSFVGVAVGGGGVGGAGPVFPAGEVRITDPNTGAQKGQKDERFDLVPWDAMEELARVYGVGARKYDDWNWLKGYRWSLSLGALIRHVAKYAVGIDRDAETGCHHLAHAAWHCMTLLTFAQRGLGTDDRKRAVAT